MTRRDEFTGSTTSANPKSLRQANITACLGKSTAPTNSISSLSPSSRTPNTCCLPMLTFLPTAREGLLCVSLAWPGALESAVKFLPPPRQRAPAQPAKQGLSDCKPGLQGTNLITGCPPVARPVDALVCLHNEIVTTGLAYPAGSGNLLFRR